LKATHILLLAVFAISIISTARPAHAYFVTLTIQAVGGAEISITQGTRIETIVVPEAGEAKLKVEPGTYTLKAQKIVPGFAGFQRVFLHWCINLCCRDINETNPITISLNQDLAILARYITIYTQEKPCNISVTTTDAEGKPLPGIAVTIDSQDATMRQQDRTSREGKVTFDTLTGTHHIDLPDVVEIDEETRYEFKAWSDGANTAARAITTLNDTELLARYDLCRRLILQTTGLGGETWTVFGVNGRNVSANDANPASIWIPEGAEVKIFADPTTTPAAGVRYSFKTWSGLDHYVGDPSSNILTLSAGDVESVTANYKRQYQLAIISDLGNPRGSGWYDEGSNATIEVEPYINQGKEVRLAFECWAGDISSNLPTQTVTVARPLSIIANWKTQYEITMLFKIANENRTIQPNLAILKSLVNPEKRVSLTNYSNIWLDAGGWALEEILYQRSHLNVEPSSFAINSPTQLTFTCPIYDVTFTVRDLWGLPAVGASILLRLSNGTVATTLTDAEGRARFLSIPGGPLVAQITELLQVQISTNLSETHGRPIEVVLTLSINSVTRIALIAIAIITAVLLIVKRYPPKRIRFRLRKQRRPMQPEESQKEAKPMSKVKYALAAIPMLLLIATVQPSIAATAPTIDNLIILAPKQVRTGEIFQVTAETYVHVYG
jgi:hypothetical protein